MVCSIGSPYTNFVNYAEDSSTASNQTVENSRWFGRGAQVLGLSNQVTSFSYKNAYQGIDDCGNSLRRKLANKNTVPGRDLTFSAPKSVSLLALVKEDQQVLNAHNQAVNRALDYIEKNCIYTRTGKGGSCHQQTHNMVAAIFQHHDSRNLDPNLHSHCVIFNHTQGEDGKWRAMDNRELYQQKMLIGMVYRHELSQQLIELGHSVDWKENAIFELTNFKPEQLQQFSSRRAEIISVAGKNSSSKTKAYACVSTRNKKRYIKADDRKTIRAAWAKKCASLELPTAQTLSKSDTKSGKTAVNSQQLLSCQELIDKSIQALNSKDHKTRFLKYELLKEVLIQAQGQYKLDSIEKELEQHPNLIEIEDGKLTTVELYQKERALLRKDNPSGIQASDTKKESNVLHLATSVLNDESHRKYIDSPSKTEQFSLVEVDGRNSKMSHAVENYLHQAEKLKDKVIILTDTKAEENELTNNVRQELIQRRKLGSNPVHSVRLQQKNIDKKDLTKTENYQVGNMVKFNRQSKRFNNWHLYKILRIDEERKVLTLGDRFGSRVELPLNRYQNREVYEVKRRELRVNEKLRFSRSQCINNKQVLKGQPFEIIEIQDKQKIIISISGRHINVNSSKLLHSEYNYAATLEQCQSRNIDSCIYYPSTAKSNQLFKQDIYEAASRTTAKLIVYTTDNYRLQIQPTQSSMEPFNQTNSEPIDSLKSIDDTLFELASSAKYIVLNEGQRSELINQLEEFEPPDTRNGGLLDKIVYDSPDGVMIEKDPQNLSIYYDGKTTTFDQNYNVKKNELSEHKTRILNQKIQVIKQQSLEQNRNQQTRSNIDLSI